MNYIEFKELMQKWHKDTAMRSVGIEKHQVFEDINAYAKKNKENLDQIRSYAVLSLKKFTHPALNILYAIVPPDECPPIDKYYAGRVSVIIECWIYWGLEKDYIGVGYNPNKYWHLSKIDALATEDISN